jgi:predicted RNase H-like nuclease (RuvC/YqgF family)
MYQKKIEELTRNINKLNGDVEMWRKRANHFQDKYHSMRSVFNKDRYIGINNREEENNINHPNNTAVKETRKVSQTPAGFPSKMGNPNSNLMEELNSMADHLKSARVQKKQVSFAGE